MKKRNMKEIGNNNIVTKQETEHVGAILIARRAQRKRLKHTQNGITLVALVITIIVLLILAGVTINLTLGERGIFRIAEKAAKNYQDSQQEEMYGLNSLQNEINNTIGNLGNSATIPNVAVTNIEITPNSDTIMVNETVQLTVKVLPNNATNKGVTWSSSNSDVATVAQDGKVTGVAVGTTTIIATAKDGSGIQGNYTITVATATLSSVALPGDYVEYDGGNGYTGKWQVLYNDSTYGLQIISSSSVGTVTLTGKDGYNNAVNILNDYCAKYVNTGYATIARSVGSNPLAPVDTTTDTVRYPWNNTNSGCKVGDDTNFTVDCNAMKNAIHQSISGIIATGGNYWLASRYVDYDPSFCLFNMRYIDSSGSGAGCNLLNVNSSSRTESSESRGVRAIITLRSGIQTSGGNGSKDAAFKLVAK